MSKGLRAPFVLVCVLGACAFILYQFSTFIAVRQTVPIKLRDSSGDVQADAFDKAILKNLRHFSGEASFVGVMRGAETKSVDLDSFRLDRCEVRQGSFLNFSDWANNQSGREFAYRGEPANHVYASASETHMVLHRATAPATGISFYDAYAYCKASGGRLPTPEEWEAATQGKSGSLYPWGNEFSGEAWSNPEPLLNLSAKCGEFSGNATPEGADSMGSGVSEWTFQPGADASDDTFFLSGGNARQKPFDLYAMSFVRQRVQPFYRSEYAGFRCAYDVPPASKFPWSGIPDTVSIEGGQYQLGLPAGSIMGVLLPGLTKEELKKLPSIYSKAKSASGQVKFSRYEASVWQFYFFLYDPLVWLGLYDHPDRPAGHRYLPLEWEFQKTSLFNPVYGVDWWTAYAFANRMGGRLPSAEEWSQAYTNDYTTFYPWGGDEEDGLSISRFWNVYAPAPLDETSLDITPEGIAQLAGNVSEWTRTTSLTPTGYEFLIKGGNYILPFSATKSYDFKTSASPSVKDLGTGIRVVFD